MCELAAVWCFAITSNPVVIARHLIYKSDYELIKTLAIHTQNNKDRSQIPLDRPVNPQWLA